MVRLALAKSDLPYQENISKEGNMEINKNYRFILSALENAGFSAYLVGGCVRDMLMELPIHDYDVTTNALPEQISNVFADYKVIPTGIRHGTVTVIYENTPFEITTFRIDGKYTDSRRPDNVVFTDSLYDDLSRRDFTVNSIAMDLNGKIYDPFNGADDIRKKIIKCVGDPTKRFTEDALRILRAIRFSSVLGFDIEKNTAAAVHTLKNRLDNVSAERISVELVKLINGVNSTSVLLEYRDIIGQLIPELIPSFDHDQHTPYHKYNVYEHTVRAIKAIPSGIDDESTLRLTMLLHDVGKPAAFYLDENGRGHFKGHAQIGAEIARKVLRRLKFDNKTINFIYKLIYYHSEDIKNENEMKHLFGKMGPDDFLKLLEVKKADNNAKHSFVLDENIELDNYAELARRYTAENVCLSLSSLAVNGSDLMEIGLKGKEIGEWLDKLLDMVIDEKLPNERAALLSFVGEMKI